MLGVAFENNIDAYTETVTEFIRKCIGDIVHTVMIKTYLNQKPWIDECSICTKLKAHLATVGNYVNLNKFIRP
jgi:hypothetical protein